MCLVTLNLKRWQHKTAKMLMQSASLCDTSLSVNPSMMLSTAASVSLRLNKTQCGKLQFKAQIKTASPM